MFSLFLDLAYFTLKLNPETIGRFYSPPETIVPILFQGLQVAPVCFVSTGV
jgi:hypothetical protein